MTDPVDIIANVIRTHNPHHTPAGMIAERIEAALASAGFLLCDSRTHAVVPRAAIAQVVERGHYDTCSAALANLDCDCGWEAMLAASQPAPGDNREEK